MTFKNKIIISAFPDKDEAYENPKILKLKWRYIKTLTNIGILGRNNSNRIFSVENKI